MSHCAPAIIVLTAMLVMFCIYIASIFRRAWKQRHQPNQDPFPETKYGYEESLRFRHKDRWSKS